MNQDQKKLLLEITEINEPKKETVNPIYQHVKRTPLVIDREHTMEILNNACCGD